MDDEVEVYFQVHGTVYQKIEIAWNCDLTPARVIDGLNTGEFQTTIGGTQAVLDISQSPPKVIGRVVIQSFDVDHEEFVDNS